MDEQTQSVSMKRIYLTVLLYASINSFISPFLSLVLKTGMPSPVVTFYRLLLVSVVMMPLALGKKSNRESLKLMSRRHWIYFVLYSVTKAGGFILWAEGLRLGAPSFTMTTLSNMGPIFVVIFSFLLLHEKTSLSSLGGIAICLVGVTVIGIENIAALGSPIAMIVIIICCMCNALNTIFGRVVRLRMEIVPMMGLSYFICAVLAGLYALVQNMSFAIPAAAWLPLLGVSWGCTLVGHSLSIWTLKYIKPVTASVMNLVSPFFTAISAYFLLGEVPKPIMFVGALIMVLGLLVYQRSENRIAKREAERRAAEEQPQTA